MKNFFGRRLLATLLAVVMMGAMLAIPTLAADDKTVKTDKTEYVVGEPIMVTATGTGKDWVGLYLKTDVIPDDWSIYWYYVENSGTKNIREVAPNNGREDYYDLPAGEYVFYLHANDGYEILDKAEFTIVEATAAVETPATPESPKTSDPAVIAAVLTAVSAMGAVVLKKKH